MRRSAARPEAGFGVAESVWAAESEAPRPPAGLAGRLCADIAIVGGGFTGVSTAWHLRQRHPELRIVLLEARVLGHGASGRNGGQVLHWVNGVTPQTPDAAAPHPRRDAAGDRHRGTARAALHAPAGTFRRNGCLEMYTDPQRAEHAHARVEAWNAAGIAAEFVPRAALGMHGACGAIRDPLAGTPQRLRAAAGDATRAARRRRRGVRGHAGAARAAGRRSRDRDGARRSARERRRARHQRLHAVARLLPPRHPAAALARAGDRAARRTRTWSRIGWGAWDGFSDDFDRIAYALPHAWRAAALRRRRQSRLHLSVRGQAEIAVHAGDAAERFLRASMTNYFPSLADGADRASLGRHARASRSTASARWASAANTATSITRSATADTASRSRCSPAACSRISTTITTSRGATCPSTRSALLPMPPEPLRWLGYQAYTRVTGRSPRKQG